MFTDKRTPSHERQVAEDFSTNATVIDF